MGEARNLRRSYKRGDVVDYSGPVVLLSRFHATWPSWEETGLWWQWWALTVDVSGKVSVERILENSLPMRKRTA